MMNRRGSVVDVFLVMIVMILVFGITFFIGNKISNTVNPALKGFLATQGITNPLVNATIDNATAVTNNFDNVFVFLYIGLLLALFITALMINVHPAFAVVFLLVFIIAVIVSVAISNFYETLSTNADMAATALNFPKMGYIFAHLPAITFIVGIFAMIVTYAKSSFMGGGEGGGQL
jgi:hypothetical protein